MTLAWSTMMTSVLEHFDDKDMEHCDEKGREHCDDWLHGAL